SAARDTFRWRAHALLHAFQWWLRDARGLCPALCCVARLHSLAQGNGRALFRGQSRRHAGNRERVEEVFSRSHDAVIRVSDNAGNVIETHEHDGGFKETWTSLPSCSLLEDTSLYGGRNRLQLAPSAIYLKKTQNR